MFDVDNISDLFLDNIKKLFFPEEWIQLDMRFSKFELFTLLFIDKRKETTMTELVEYINSPMSTATGIIDRLVRNGYVVRERSDTDRRIVIIKLTDNGLHFIRKFKDMISAYLNLVLEDLTEEEKQFLVGIVLKVMKRLSSGLNNTETSSQSINNIKQIEIE